MIFAIRKKIFVLFACFFVFIFTFGFLISSVVTTDGTIPLGITIVLDAGHGGADGGTVGVKTKVTESELNLKFTKKLTKYLSDFGIKIINTRETMDGLYEKLTDDYKKIDMQKRAEIINQSNAQLLVSIHMNKFSDPSQNGAQVFFKQDNDESEKLASGIRDILVANFDNARSLVLKGDYYILNCTNINGVIVECGFLSNQKDEENLCNEEYQNKMCYSIYCGIINYLNLIKY